MVFADNPDLLQFALEFGDRVDKAAGQTDARFHSHVMPRWHGGVDDPRGGNRNMLGGLGNYHTEIPPTATARAECMTTKHDSHSQLL